MADLKTNSADVDAILTARAAELEAIDDTLICETVGVAQAADDLRKSLDALDGLLDAREFEKAAALGYRDIASAFIFLQRTLGGLQSADLSRHEFTSTIAQALQCAFEDAEPHVTARFQCLKPKPNLADEERAAIKAEFEARIRKMGLNSPE
ncbi:hypothetical protein [Primorskyibacter flagellatus]|uniref:hypothetical protein n=1 Tax=Primorskyibacter flagellatus TaxID=1387277 RepID=UPI0009FEA763|nr:hypothetical protein [Primorskyibacter flagellatus]